MAAIYLGGFTVCFLAGRDWLPPVLEPEVLDSHQPLPGRVRADRSRQEVVARHELSGREQRVSHRVSHQCKGIPSQARRRARRNAFRIAFVGDSFTEAMQVGYDSSFCARLEKLLAPPDGSRALVCENFGVSATDLLEYWHRIHHDVLAVDPPEMIVLCIYPGNDFQAALPDDAFDSSDEPLRGLLPQSGSGAARDRLGESALQIRVLHCSAPCSASAAAAKPRRGRHRRTGGPTRSWRLGPLECQWCGDHGRSSARSSRNAAEKGPGSACWWSGRLRLTGPQRRQPARSHLFDWGLDIPVIDVAIKARGQPEPSVARRSPSMVTSPTRATSYLASEAAPALEALVKQETRMTHR